MNPNYDKDGKGFIPMFNNGYGKPFDVTCFNCGKRISYAYVFDNKPFQYYCFKCRAGTVKHPSDPMA